MTLSYISEEIEAIRWELSPISTTSSVTCLTSSLIFSFPSLIFSFPSVIVEVVSFRQRKVSLFAVWIPSFLKTSLHQLFLLFLVSSMSHCQLEAFHWYSDIFSFPLLKQLKPSLDPFPFLLCPFTVISHSLLSPLNSTALANGKVAVMEG